MPEREILIFSLPLIVRFTKSYYFLFVHRNVRILSNVVEFEKLRGNLESVFLMM